MTKKDFFLNAVLACAANAKILEDTDGMMTTSQARHIISVASELTVQAARKLVAEGEGFDVQETGIEASSMPLSDIRDSLCMRGGENINGILYEISQQLITLNRRLLRS